MWSKPNVWTFTFTLESGHLAWWEWLWDDLLLAENLCSPVVVFDTFVSDSSSSLLVCARAYVLQFLCVWEGKSLNSISSWQVELFSGFCWTWTEDECLLLIFENCDTISIDRNSRRLIFVLIEVKSIQKSHEIVWLNYYRVICVCFCDDSGKDSN